MHIQYNCVWSAMNIIVSTINYSNKRVIFNTTTQLSISIPETPSSYVVVTAARVSSLVLSSSRLLGSWPMTLGYRWTRSPVRELD